MYSEKFDLDKNDQKAETQALMPDQISSEWMEESVRCDFSTGAQDLSSLPSLEITEDSDEGPVLEEGDPIGSTRSGPQKELPQPDTPPDQPRRLPDRDVGSTQEWSYPDGTSEVRKVANGRLSLIQRDENGRTVLQITSSGNPTDRSYEIAVRRADGSITRIYGSNLPNSGAQRHYIGPGGVEYRDQLRPEDADRQIDFYRRMITR